jgi:hypothetical protein
LRLRHGGVPFVRVSVLLVRCRARCRLHIRVVRVAAFIVGVGVGGVERGSGVGCAPFQQFRLFGRVIRGRGIGVKQAAQSASGVTG